MAGIGRKCTDDHGRGRRMIEAAAETGENHRSQGVGIIWSEREADEPEAVQIKAIFEQLLAAGAVGKMAHEVTWNEVGGHH